MAYELQSLDRALQLLSTLASEHPLRLVDLADRLAANQTTILRTLRVLERYGYVRRSRNGTEYVLGPRLAELGLAATSSIDVSETLQPWTSLLSREFHATAHIGTLRGNMITVIAKLDAPEARVQYSSLGTQMPLHATAAGKASLALLAPNRSTLLALVSPMQPYTPQSIIDVESLETAIETTASNGYSVEREEYQIGFGCVGWAFRFDSDIYTVSLSGPLVGEAELESRGARLKASMSEFQRQYAGAVQGIS